MDAEERLTALKKAYADVILNVSKESAARVMASNRKSLQFQHELNVAKEEGSRMLLRMKQMMDSKISEAKAAALNQQKKIEELEAQLQEAEDIVKDLREELVQVRAELEKVNIEKSQHVNEPENAWSREIQEGNANYPYQSPNESCVAYAYDVGHRNGCGMYIVNRDLPSIILRSKEVGPYRNGCTQRIRACERNLSDRQLCLSEEKGKETSESPNSVSETLSELEKKLVADIDLSGSQSFPLKRKRATRRRKTVIPLCPELSLDKVELQTQTRFAQSCEEDRNFDETGLAESLLSLNSKVDVEKNDTPSNNLEANSCDIIKSLPSQRVNEKAVKNTYQRRRKRQALIDIKQEMRSQSLAFQWSRLGTEGDWHKLLVSFYLCLGRNGGTEYGKKPRTLSSILKCLFI